MSGLNATWIIPHEHAKHVEGTTFVRVAGSHNASLLKLVCEHNPLAKGMNLRSLASSRGLMELRMVRNATQARELGAPASTLFAADSVTPRKARRMPTWRLRCSSAMQIEVPLGDAGTHLLQVLKPGTSKDALYVEFEANTMSVVIQCLREFGFAPVDAMKLKPDGEKGIQRRKHGKLLVKKQLGKHKSQIVPTLWDALQLQMQNAPNGDCNGEGVDDPAMDVENAAMEIHQKNKNKKQKTNKQTNKQDKQQKYTQTKNKKKTKQKQKNLKKPKKNQNVQHTSRLVC